MSDQRMFPIQRERGAAAHPLRIPWSVAELAYSVYSAQYGTRQSLERLAERGGFGPSEMDEFYPRWREDSSEIAQLRAALAEARSGSGVPGAPEQTESVLRYQCERCGAEYDRAGGACVNTLRRADGALVSCGWAIVQAGTATKPATPSLESLSSFRQELHALIAKWRGTADAADEQGARGEASSIREMALELEAFLHPSSTPDTGETSTSRDAC